MARPAKPDICCKKSARAAIAANLEMQSSRQSGRHVHMGRSAAGLRRRLCAQRQNIIWRQPVHHTGWDLRYCRERLREGQPLQPGRKVHGGNKTGSKPYIMTVAIIGTGLIGGSMALALRENGLATNLIGVD